MKKQIPAIILSLICMLLLFELQSKQKENTRLFKKIASMEPVQEKPGPVTSLSAAEQSGKVVQTEGNDANKQTDEAHAPGSNSTKESNRRIMRNMAKTIDENPTINKMVEASQRGAIGALYSDMIAYLNLNEEETKYFMDLLMYRQMANVDAHMQIASGNLTEEEKQALMKATKLANETTRAKVEKFLNDPNDFEEFQFYEDTIGERMMLSQMDQKLGDSALSDEAYREVLEIMHDERENYAWSTDLHDNENRDLSPERFSQDNIQKHIADMMALGELMDKRMQELLTPEQLAAWRESGAAMQALMEGQLIQANQMFGSE